MAKNTSLYVHIPFCLRKCLFCSFVISVGKEHRINDYLDALEMELSFHDGQKVSTVYVGGGTPTQMNAQQLKRLFVMMRKYCSWKDNAEFTVEANPEGLTEEKLSVLKEYGVNRLSIGVQSLNDRFLKYLGRAHNREDVFNSLDKVRQFNFDNVNLDLMFAYPDQTFSDLRRDVDEIAFLGAQHLSLYELTIDKNSQFYAKGVELDDAQKRADMYQFICERLQRYGFAQYEVSNFSQEGYQSQHNRHYWMGDEYIGVGVGAHGYLDGERYWNVERLADYCQRAVKGVPFYKGREQLTNKQKLSELLLFGLRMNEGVSIRRIEMKAGCSLSKHQQKQLSFLSKEGFLENSEKNIAATSKGRLVLDDLAVKLIDS